MRRASLSAFALIASALPALAAPCVSDTFDVPLPGATDVSSYVTDVASSQFPAFWQEGRLEGYRYKIFANGTGALRPSRADAYWTIDLVCDLSSQTCVFDKAGTPPSAAIQVAQRIGGCFGHKAPEDDGGGQPALDISQNAPFEPQALAQDAVETSCGVAIVDEKTDVATMQRLLIMLGSTPGLADGFLGPATFAAMGDFVDDPGWSTSIPDVISQLDTLHCSRP